MPSTELFDGSQKLRYEVLDLVNIVRQHHALEHATINILLTRLEGKIRLVGRAGLTGFHLYGNIPTEILEEAAQEALRRLQEGEEELAISPMCGTNLVVAGVTAGVASMIAGRGHKGLSKFNRIVQASIIAMLAAQPLGRLTQKHLTTKPDLDNVSILKVTRKGSGARTRHIVKVSHQ